MDSTQRHGVPPLPDTIDVTSPDFFRDPYPLYAELRRVAPVVPLRTGGYMLVRHENILDVLGSPVFGNAPSRFSTLHPRNRDKYTAADLAANILPFMDPPEHTLPRRLISRVFRQRISTFTAELEGLAEQQVAMARDAGATEVIGQIAEPYSLASMCRFIGVPETDGPLLKAMSDDFFYLFAPISDPDKFAEINQQLDTFRNYFREHLKARRSTPRDDLISLLAVGVTEEEGMGDEWVIDTCILLFADGVENVPYGIGNVLLEMGNDSGKLAEAGLSVAAAGPLVTEALRLNPPAQLLPRIVQADISIAGQVLKAGTPLYLALASANRDETVFENADSFHVGRDRTNILTFGAGRHACIGAVLAALQCSAIISSLARTRCRLQPESGGVDYIPRFGHRWPTALNIAY